VVEPLNRVVRVLPDAASAARALADRILQLADAVRPRSRPFSLAISGGRTPEPTFRELAKQADGPRRWNDWQLFWCDERLVPPTDPRSNFGVARSLWLGPAGFPRGNVHPVDTTVPAEEAAARYDSMLRGVFDGPDAEAFDLALLGVGPDGHTASLFPGAASLGVVGRWAVAEPHPSLPPLVPRVTLTLEGLGRARTALFLVCGADKRRVLETVLAPSARAPRGAALPAARVRPQGTVEWFLDQDAAPSFDSSG
jgi:6-phosphogluconolactonase